MKQKVTSKFYKSNPFDLELISISCIQNGSMNELLNIVQQCRMRYLQYSSTEFLMWFDPKHPGSTSTCLFYIAYLKLLLNKVGKGNFLFLPLVKVFSRRER